MFTVNYFRWFLSLTAVAFLIKLPSVAIGPFIPFGAIVQIFYNPNPFTLGPIDISPSLFENISSQQAFLVFLFAYQASFFSLLVLAGASHVVLFRLRGRPVGIRQAISSLPRYGLSALGMAFSLSILGSIPILLFFGKNFFGNPFMYPVLLFFFSVTSTVAMVYMVILFFVALPAATCERPGLLTGLYRGFLRSIWLTRGNRWRLLALVLIMFAMTAGLAQFAYPLLTPLEHHLSQAVLQVLVPSSGEHTLESAIFANRAVSAALSAMTVPIDAFIAVVLSVAYYRLRLENEGADVDTLTKVFD